MKITYQNYGTSILIFIQGETEQEASDKWLSLYNWGATSTEARWVAANVIACWSTLEKFQRYLFNIHENRLFATLPKGKLQAAAESAAQKEFATFEREAYRSVNNNNEVYEMGVILAERPDDEYSATDFGSAMMERYVFKE
jgi:hypothetical protein